MYRQFRVPLAATVTAAAFPAFAQESNIPSQEDWVDAKQEVTLESGLDVSYVEIGTPDGHPVLLLHGYTDNSRSWSLLAPHLGGRRLIAMDLRGHGDSEAPPCCYGLDTLANDVDRFMEKVGINEADVVGHSLGSMTAATLAAYYPDRVDELVLISSSTYMPKGASDWLWNNVPSMEHPLDPESEFIMNWYSNPTPVDEDFISRERAESAAAPKATWMGVLRGLTLTDWTPIASRIEAPTLILWGDQDGFFGVESQEHIQKTLPEAQHITYEGYGHNMFWEIPEKAGRDITDFLSE